MRTSTTIFTKKIWMYHFGKFTSIWNCVCCQYCTVPPLLCCIILHRNTSTSVVTYATSMKYCPSMKVPLCQKYQCWSRKNALPVCCHWICLWFKYQYLESWKMCYRYTVNKFVCSLSTSLNTGTLSSKMGYQYTVI